MEVEIWRARTNEVIASFGPIVMRIVDGAFTEREDIEYIEEILDGPLAGARATGVLLVVHHGSPLPGMEVRREVIEFCESRADRTTVVMAVLGLGFWASTVRVAARAASALMRNNTMYFHTDLESAAERLVMDLVGIDPGAVIRAYDYASRGRMREAG